MGCGTDYTKLFKTKYWYSNLDHSVGVALIIWNFTKNKKQTLAGLFHDIATPVFKHVIDFLHGDHEGQESTEKLTTDIIKNSHYIMKLLKRDGIKLEEVNDYKKYSIADNNMPQLSADRLEYNFSSGLVKSFWNLKDIEDCYKDIIILKNEKGISELGFQNLNIAEKYISIVSKLWPIWVNSESKVTMQFLADIMKYMIERKYIKLEDLYLLSEKEIIEQIINSKDKYLSQAFINFQLATKVFDSKVYIENKYCISIKSKMRYIIPLVKVKNKNIRVNVLSNYANKKINEFLKFETALYSYFDFEFNSNNN